MSDDKLPASGSYASPPCFAHEVDPAYSDPAAVDLQQAVDVARWRKAERKRLRNERAVLSVAERARVAEALAEHLGALVSEQWETVAGQVLSGYWPIKGESDLRGWLAAQHEAGAVTALPVVETKAAPLVFRAWSPRTKMVRGDWNIPVPRPEAERVVPAIALAPLVGWDAAGYRLGYGGGYFDRTLAALSPRPFTIGVGLQQARIETIYPQPHDIRLDAIATEEGVQFLAER